MNILLTLVVVLNLAILVVLLLAARRFTDIYRTFVAFVTPAGENKASPVAELVNQISANAGVNMANVLKATFMGTQSGEKRGEQGVLADIAFDSAAARAPVLASLLESFPSLRKRLAKNPALVEFALSKLAGLVGKPGSVAPGISDYAARLAKYEGG